MDEFVNHIRKLALSCQFGTLREELIRDKLVLGISNKSTKLRLLREEDLTLNKAMNICRSSEIENIQLKSMKASSKEVKEVHAVQGKTHRKPNKTSLNGGKTKLCATKDHRPAAKGHNSLKRKCYHCGRLLDHKLKDCPAFGQTCNSCGKKNHFASVYLQNKAHVMFAQLTNLTKNLSKNRTKNRYFASKTCLQSKHKENSSSQD